jgi:Omp85 superfamily domain
MVRSLCILAAIARVAAADVMSPADLARKPERSHVTGLPLFAYSVDFGYGAGARAYYYWNGTRDDPRFARTPYLLRIFASAFATTGGLQFYTIDVDAPAVFDSPYRVRSQLVFLRNIDASYFGFTEASRTTLRFPGVARDFGSYDAYHDAERRIYDGLAYTRYDRYDLMRPAILASVERPLFDDRLRFLVGVTASYARVEDYTGKTVSAVTDTGDSTSAPSAPTRLREDCDRGILVGCDGGRDNQLRLAVTFDTRDYEPDPNRGIYADLAIDLASVALASEYDYVRALVAVRGFYSPFPAAADLVLAGRFLLQAQSAGTPFFTMDVLPFVEDSRTGLGGHRTIRGYRQSRFVDHVMSAASAEVRWTFARTTVWRQKLAFIAVPFFDVGRAYDSLSDLTVRGLKPGAGAALRVSWNLATLGTFEYARSPEGTGVYVNFGHMF